MIGLSAVPPWPENRHRPRKVPRASGGATSAPTVWIEPPVKACTATPSRNSATYQDEGEMEERRYGERGHRDRHAGKAGDHRALRPKRSISQPAMRLIGSERTAAAVAKYPIDWSELINEGRIEVQQVRLDRSAGQSGEQGDAEVVPARHEDLPQRERRGVRLPRAVACDRGAARLRRKVGWERAQTAPGRHRPGTEHADPTRSR